MASFLLRRSDSGMSEKRSATELAFTCFSILSIVSSSRFGRKGCASTISWSDPPAFRMVKICYAELSDQPASQSENCRPRLPDIGDEVLGGNPEGGRQETMLGAEVPKPTLQE